MSLLLESIVRISDENPNVPGGTGFVITKDGLIATCSHVILSEKSQDKGEPKPEYVKLNFAYSIVEGLAKIMPDRWISIKDGDLAILKLVEPPTLPSGVKPVPLSLSSGCSDHEFRTFGYPVSDGRWGCGKIFPENPNPRSEAKRTIQLKSSEVTEGFSGAPILDWEVQRVVGMITSIDSYDKYGKGGNAFAIISDELLKICPELKSVLQPIPMTMINVKEKAVDLLANATKVYQGSMANYSTIESDALYYFLSNLDIDKLETESFVFAAFESMFEYLETLSDQAAYNPTMLVAECLAALLTKSLRYNQIIQNSLVQDHWTRKLAAIRAYSKLAEINPQMVDTNSILSCATVLDRKYLFSKQDQLLIGHMIRTVGKIKDTKVGEDLIESLAGRNSVSKRVAAGAIAINPADTGSIFMLSFLQEHKKRTVEEKAPSTFLLRLLVALLQDPDLSVHQEAVNTAEELKRTYSNLNLESYHPLPSWKAQSLEIRTFSGNRLPFSGRVSRVTKQNWDSVSKEKEGGIIYCLEEKEIPESAFFGGSGFILLNQGGLSHQCVRLINEGMPFAIVTEEDMKKLPQGKYAVVAEDGILSVR